MMMPPLSQFSRDLSWVFNSPNLLATSPDHNNALIVSETYCQQLFKDIDCQPAFSSPHTRLGRYFEDLIIYAIRNNPACTLLAHNLGIYADKHQLGELDLIFRHQQTTYHWELAVKFYILHDDTKQYVGPNARDLLDLKLTKLFHHQLNLPQQACAQRLLREKFGIHQLYSQALIKGYLFYPWQNTQEHIGITDLLNPNHLRGWWCYQHQLVTKLATCNNQHRWLILPRLRWLSKVDQSEADDLLEAQNLLPHVQAHHSPPLVVEVAAIDGHWREVSRGFVVPDHWPAS